MADWRPYTMVKPAEFEISSSSSDDESSPPTSPAQSDSGFLVQPKDEVRKELLNAIKTKRRAKGLEELPEIDSKRPKSDELTPEEEEKRRLRRERNKVAAFRCRQRRKQHITELEKITEQVTSCNEDLEKEILDLQNQKDQLEEMLKSHSCKKERTTVINITDCDENKENSQTE